MSYVLVDSSIVIPWLKNDSSLGVRMLDTILLEQQDPKAPKAAIPVWAKAECLSGASDWAATKQALDVFLEAAPPIRDWISFYTDAAKIGHDARKRENRTIESAVDLFIAQLALKLRAPLLHNDLDFESIKLVRRNLRTLTPDFRHNPR